ncbi:hypothetical protein O0I10_002648 [Lichtheimia ornata]|uniref:Uncharacterized protein n=1 Tax=Lichtheimia ornata TaxID=688661 RepID=A0AAD7VBG3_9FUNG|nr:uncharacterized protein O0I10_002648 [Lichtheimia ornata]KAJ8661382.1 hypothetical protein O0I10_002648 [Lichtheimia ornata]
MVPLAATGYGSQSKNAVWLAQCETAARQHGWHGDTVFICDKNAIEQHHKGFKNASSVLTAPSFYGY